MLTGTQNSSWLTNRNKLLVGLFQDLFLSFGFDSSVSDVNIGILDEHGNKYVMEEFMDEFNLNKVKIFIAEFVNTRGQCCLRPAGGSGVKIQKRAKQVSFSGP